jgi:hypothetical protein
MVKEKLLAEMYVASLRELQKDGEQLQDLRTLHS